MNLVELRSVVFVVVSSNAGLLCMCCFCCCNRPLKYTLKCMVMISHHCGIPNARCATNPTDASRRRLRHPLQWQNRTMQAFGRALCRKRKEGSHIQRGISPHHQGRWLQRYSTAVALHSHTHTHARTHTHTPHQDNFSEKNLRAALKAAVERQLSKETIVILDSINYIKGYRYELYCIARALRTPNCVVSLSWRCRPHGRSSWCSASQKR